LEATAGHRFHETETGDEKIGDFTWG